MKRVINFMGVRHVAFALTVVLTLVSLASLAVKGLNFGLDFTGGTLIELSYEQPIALDQVRSQLVSSGFNEAVVQSFGATTDVLVRMPGDDPLLGERIAEALRGGDAGSAVTVKRVEFVGPAVGEELRDQGGLGMLLALGGILVYVAFRFQWKFGLGAVLSLFHDVILVLGVFSLFQISFDLTVLAAVLAVIGYSLNDTIVIFDRIRENFRMLRKAELLENINISTTQTLLRTLATSVSTLLAVGALMFFGGENLWGFSLALLIGVGAGTYSSVYVAGMLLVWLNLTREDLIPPVVEEVDELP
ncbi:MULTISPECIES: protein translocase subunit SecF [Pseudomonadaceae]|jgi:preprotein translocase subunit SecF|uniref:protein translocase subunit SecF n=1 Tax=Pseudomonadaceae TaxID=135621 RepID=UPI000617BE1D|nr:MULTISPECIES: protein translocase subunit SecF [Pseudomonadaceae]MAL35984.1 protein translocase subunit SecF [Pseudomonas sp.]MBU0949308.1 protein translocase subunit SecF [Gammaproteobacteria bacterium]KJJ63443.1 preprotein translocase subunit SecF [Pseudomonas sp. 10B238]MBK3794748.1 protein translocase subunit SecF [Stutzerimonas stutzeri]MBK3878899.1 protein translocase subunit SecF [Stutzerimonas stutzeri]|tara:strand:+ start:1900 stop:2808 length:909 start_codon:yes stop_codon:yes gene_type:complete